MKITCNAGDMKKALSIAMSAMAPRPAQAALGCVLMDAAEGAVAISATDGSMEISVRMEEAVKEAGTALLPGKLLAEYVGVASGEITLSVDEKHRCVLSGAGRKSTVAGLPPEEYVICALPDTAPTVFMAGEAFSRLVNGCAFCAGADEARKTLVSVYAAFGPDKAEFVSLDGYRMALVHGACRAQAPLHLLMPVSCAQIAAKLFGGAEELSIGGVEKRHCLLTGGGVTMRFPLLSGEYIDYGKLALRSAAGEVMLPARALLQAVKNANVAARFQQKESVTLEMADEMLRVSASSAQTDASSEIPEAQARGEIPKIAFNGRYLEESLSRVGDDEIACGFASAVSPLVIRPRNQNDDSFLYLVMPVRQIGG